MEFPARVRFRHLAVAAVVMAVTTALLGVYTAAVGAGLTCGTRWPFCDGAVLGLFPASWPSFWEWFHRLWAMLTGFVLLGTLYAAWRRQPDRRIARLTTLAVALLPLQVGLGAVTVRMEGLFPWGYSPPVQALHFSVALAIVTLLAAAAALSTPLDRDRVATALAAATLLVPVASLFSYGTLFVYGPTVQAVYYGLSLISYVLLVAATVGARSTALRALGTVGAGLFALLLLLGRRLLGRIDPVVGDAVTATLLVALLAAALLAHRERVGGASRTARPRESD